MVRIKIQLLYKCIFFVLWYVYYVTMFLQFYCLSAVELCWIWRSTNIYYYYYYYSYGDIR